MPWEKHNEGQDRYWIIFTNPRI